MGRFGRRHLVPLPRVRTFAELSDQVLAGKPIWRARSADERRRSARRSAASGPCSGRFRPSPTRPPSLEPARGSEAARDGAPEPLLGAGGIARRLGGQEARALRGVRLVLRGASVIQVVELGQPVTLVRPAAAGRISTLRQLVLR